MTSNTPLNLIAYGEAMHALFRGKKITRVEWMNESIYGFAQNVGMNVLAYIMRDGKAGPWVASDGDEAGQDWYALPE